MSDIALENGMEMRQGPSMAMLQNLNILQAPSLELRQMISQSLATNPVLEAASDFESLDFSPESDLSGEMEAEEWGGYSSVESAPVVGNRDFYLDSLVAHESLADHLRSQLLTSGLGERSRDAVDFLIGSLDRRGYLDSSLEDLSSYSGFSIKELRSAINELKSYDPAGVGARDLRESLLYQLEVQGRKNSVEYRVVSLGLEDLARHRYEVLAETLSLPVEEVVEAARQIALLSPDPGAPFDSEINRTVTPDIEIRENDAGELTIHLTRGNVPVLSLNSEYKQILAEAPLRSELHSYLKKSFQEARQLISALELRQETLMKLAQFLVLKQEEFFLYGIKYLKPLSMNEAAEALGVHTTTISRAVSGKYLLCEHGLFELRHFFSSGYQNESGEQISAHAVREVISRLVLEENPKKPLSDSEIAMKLKEEGLSVARRTVAKYREQLKILPANLRKSHS